MSLQGDACFLQPLTPEDVSTLRCLWTVPRTGLSPGLSPRRGSEPRRPALALVTRGHILGLAGTARPSDGWRSET